MIRLDPRGKCPETCNCCNNTADLDLVYGYGDWPSHTTRTRLCRACITKLMDEIHHKIGDHDFNHSRIHTPELCVANEPKQKVIFTKYQCDHEGVAYPASEVFKEIEC